MPAFVNDNLGSPAAAARRWAWSALRPLFHLFNGDLCYANLADDRVRTWWDFWENNSRSARNRPWMPSAGNHENELGNGPIGYQAYQTYFSLPPAAGQTDVTRGFGTPSPSGRCGSSASPMTTSPIRTAAIPMFAAIRTGLRRPGWRPDLPPRAPTATSTGSSSACTRWPSPPPTRPTARIWASARNGFRCSTNTAWTWWCAGTSTTMSAPTPSAVRRPTPPSHPYLPPAAPTLSIPPGTVHMVIGGGGTSKPSNDPVLQPAAVPSHRLRRRARRHRQAAAGLRQGGAPWSAARNAAHAYGFAAFTVDPGSRPGGLTRIEVTYYDVAGPDGALTPFERFTLQRPRRD